VLTLLNSAAAAASPLGLLIAGPVADLAGVHIWFLLGGAVCLLAGVVGCFVPVIVHIEDHVCSSGESEYETEPVADVEVRKSG